jgi:hypothetical protein
MHDPISAIFATGRSTALASSALPHAPVICEERPRRRTRVRRRLMPRGR